MYTTNHQKALITFFKDHQNESFLASEVVEAFSPYINKATIYRQLAKLEEEKVIRKSFDSEKDGYVYQFASNCERHLHLQCLVCGKITHLTCGCVDSFLNEIKVEHGFSVNRYQTTIYGLCKECQDDFR